MKHIASLVVGAALIVGSHTGCQKQGSSAKETNEKLDQIIARLDKIEKQAATAGAPAAARPRAPEPPRAGRPDPGEVYAVPVADSPVEGPETAKVTIVKAFEYACPFCLRVKPTIEQIRKEYGDDVRIVYKNLIVHPQTATIPALASCAAYKQGKYTQMSDLIWEKGFNANRNLSQENMETLAKEAGLDLGKLKSDMEGSCKEMIARDRTQMTAVGARGTPAFYINGRFLSGAQPYDRFKAIIDEELAKADKAIKGGVAAREYYDKAVVAGGKKSI